MLLIKVRFLDADATSTSSSEDLALGLPGTLLTLPLLGAWPLPSAPKESRKDISSTSWAGLLTAGLAPKASVLPATVAFET
jgi:hypothetical protein